VPLDPGRAAEFVEAFLEGAGLEPRSVGTARVEAAAQQDDHLAWYEAVVGSNGQDWEAIAAEWEATADDLVERVTEVVTENLGALATEIRETGELGQLLAQAAAGKTLSADERRKVRDQLVDLAKAVPALAIFAAPGGMLLLPLLAKLLPYNVLPSSWDRGTRARAPEASPHLEPTPAAAAPASGRVDGGAAGGAAAGAATPADPVTPGSGG
jgi:hypothetical protein